MYKYISNFLTLELGPQGNPSEAAIYSSLHSVGLNISATYGTVLTLELGCGVQVRQLLTQLYTL
jgi:hypothetical protein